VHPLITAWLTLVAHLNTQPPYTSQERDAWLREYYVEIGREVERDALKANGIDLEID